MSRPNILRGPENQPSTDGGSHAVVIGGSMAGLLAGRALSEHFDQVTIIERDRFPEEPAPRKGVPQTRHLHVLLARGRIILERYLPGIVEELIAAQAPLADMAADLAWLTPAGWGVRFPSEFAVIGCSRDLLEWSIRRRLAASTRVRFLEGCDVVGLLSNAGKTCVAGARVRFRKRAGEEAARAEEQIHADLTVDASGRGSRAPQWLASLGYATPQETIVNSFLGYASRVYRRPALSGADWKGLFVQAAPPGDTRGGVIFPIEENRLMVTLAGAGGDYPPTDEDGFKEFARSLRSPLFYGAIENAEPLSAIFGYRATENRLRHYERLSRLPDGLAVIGDAVCAFNPVYAQGMTVAALSALTLDQSLRREQRRQRKRHGGELRGFTRRFQKRLAKVNATPWMLATTEDFRVPVTVGGPPDRVTRLMSRYVDRVVLLATRSVNARRLLLEVFNLLKPPTALFHPSILLQMLRQVLRPAPRP